MTRRQWLGIVPVGIALGTTGSLLFADEGTTTNSPSGSPMPDGFPSQPRELVQSVVGASHFNLDKVRKLVTERPALARASWDWGFGDWETALGAASHVGRGDIATLLMEHGARPNLFTLAMMGRLAAVKAIVEAMPGVQRTLGPHGITLMSHARAGQRKGAGNSDESRDGAREVEKYLESLGNADNAQKNLDLSDEKKQMYVGTYRFGAKADETIDVAVNNQGMLGLTIGPDGVQRPLFCFEPHHFRPGGVNETRIEFSVENDRATGLIIDDAGRRLTARRMSA